MKGVGSQAALGEAKRRLEASSPKTLADGHVAAFFALVRRTFLLHSCRVARQSVMVIPVLLQLP